MAEWNPKEEDITSINNGQEYVGGQVTRAQDLNKVVNAAFNAQNHMQQAEDDVADLFDRVDKHTADIDAALAEQNTNITDFEETVNTNFAVQNNRIEQYKSLVDERMEVAEQTANQAAQTANQAAQTANEIDGKATDALESSENALDTANKVREDFDQIVEQERDIVQEPGRGTAVVMSQKATTDVIAAAFADLTLDGGGA